MAERYQTKVPLNITQDGKVTLQGQEVIYEDMSKKNTPQTEESQYTNLQFGAKEKQTSSGGDMQVQVVKSKTNVKVIIAVSILSTICLILVAFALVMAGVTMSSSQETNKESTHSSVLIEALENQVSRLQQELYSMRTMFGAAQQNVSTLTNRQDTTQSQLSSLTNSFEDLNASIRSPIQLYQNCYTDTAEGRMTPTTSTYYTRRVNTPYRAINVTGYYTLDIRCHYVGSNYGYTVVTQLYRSGSSMLCYCTVSDPDTTYDSLSTLSTSSRYYLDCILSITRCPLSQTIV